MTKYLYRYISFESFVGMIQNKALTFVSPELWDDPKESAPFYQLVKGTEEAYFKVMLFTIYYKTYCQSWTRAVESDAMWRIYSYGNRAIQIKVSEDKLHLLENVDMIPVEYSDRIKIYPSGVMDSFIRSLAIMRSAFRHEREVRLIKHFKFANIDDLQNHIKAFLSIHEHPQMVELIESLYPGLSTEEQVDNIIHLLNVGKDRQTTYDVSFEDIDGFIKGVRVHPMAPDWYVNIVGEYCKRNSVPFLGKSKLYSAD